MPAETPVAVAIVEDDRGTREGLAALIGGTPGFRCVGTYTSVDAALRGLTATISDVLLLDIHLPGMAGSQGVRLLRERYPRTQVVMLTVSPRRSGSSSRCATAPADTF